jgi:hypothetical protein
MQATYDKLKSEVPKYKMITTSILSDRLKVRYYKAICWSCQHVMFPERGASLESECFVFGSRSCIFQGGRHSIVSAACLSGCTYG